MPDDLLCEILADAMLRSPCATATCRVSADPHRWHWVVRHLDDSGHECPVCRGDELPTYFVSIYTLLSPRRDALVASLNAFLAHCHTSAPAVSGGRDGAPATDGDATADGAAPDGGPARCGVAAVCGDRVGSSPRD